jgi:hypothetical protein
MVWREMRGASSGLGDWLGLRDQVVDEGLVRLAYGMDQDPYIDDRSWTKPKIKVGTLRAL